MPVITYRQALNDALAEELERDENVVVMGEEVAEYNGAYKITEGLWKRFGGKRVIDTPISEAGFIGLGVGAAMMGMRPVMELMFWSFAYVAYDQIINNAGCVRYMSGGLINCPLVIRGPANGGTNVGTTHSHTPENFLANPPGLKVVSPATPYDAKGLMKAAIRDNDPVCVMENTLLYGDHAPCSPPSPPPTACTRNSISQPRSSTSAVFVRWTKKPSWPACEKPTAPSWSTKTNPSAASPRRSPA